MIDSVVFLVTLIPRMVIRFFYDLPVAAARARNSDTLSSRRSAGLHTELRLRWEISKERKGQVLAQVEGQLARGERPMPRNAKQLLY